MNAKLLVPLCLLAVACGADTSSIVVRSRVATPTATAGAACQFAVGTDYVGTGTFDLTGVGTYDMALEIDNNMVDPGSAGTGQAGAQTWSAYAVRTRIINANVFYPPLVVVPSHQVVPADSTGIPANSKGAVLQTVIGRDLAADIWTALGASNGPTVLQLGVTLLGKTAAGTEIDTAEKTFPLEVCKGCLNVIPQCTLPQVAKTTASCYPWGEDFGMWSCQ